LQGFKSGVTGDGWMGFLLDGGSGAAGGPSPSSLSPSSPAGPP